MFSKILTAHLNGIIATPIYVEADISNTGLPSFSMVGLAEGAVKESRERVRSALRNLDYNIFARPITVNFAPADIKKEGSHYDLPVALALLAAMEPDQFNLDATLVAGELSLDGALRGISGVLCICGWAREHGIKKVILPAVNAAEALLVPDLEVYAFHHISEAIAYLKDPEQASPQKREITSHFSAPVRYGLDFSDVKGQALARRAAEIAAAGMHNIIMMGPPGSGKTMIARRIPTIMPDMNQNEALLTTKVHSVAGLLKDKGNLVRTRPFIAPHHTASNIAIIGGGRLAKPGHVSIATNGILFLDEMLEFNRSVLEVLRQPLEDGFVTIARADKTVTYPADFMLVAACNPCPCGYFGDSRKACTCAPYAIERYRARLSGPLLDRIDLHVQLNGVEYKDLEDTTPGESSQKIRERVVKAQESQAKRFQGTGISFNSQMNEKMLTESIMMEEDAKRTVGFAMEKFALSARAYNKILRTSRTIADLEGSPTVKIHHTAEALQYRMLDKD